MPHVFLPSQHAVWIRIQVAFYRRKLRFNHGVKPSGERARIFLEELIDEKCKSIGGRSLHLMVQCCIGASGETSNDLVDS
jgi:hypothetical protein